MGLQTTHIHKILSTNWEFLYSNITLPPVSVCTPCMFDYLRSNCNQCMRVLSMPTRNETKRITHVITASGFWNAFICWHGHSFLNEFARLRRAIYSFVMSVRPSAWNNSGPSWRIFMKFYILRTFPKSVEKIQVSLNLTRITGTLHEDLCTFMIISRSFLLRMRNVSYKICGRNQNTNFRFNSFSFSLESRTV